MEQRVGKLSDVEQNSTTLKKPFKRGPGRPASKGLTSYRELAKPRTEPYTIPQSVLDSHTPKVKRSVHPRINGKIDENVLGRSVKLIVPWDYWHYPGQKKAFWELLNFAAHPETAAKWLQTGKCPDWVLPIIESHLEQRLAALIRGLDELRDEIRQRENKTKHQVGFCVVREDGQARRGSSNRKPKTTEKL
jgi:hypothetical protein